MQQTNGTCKHICKSCDAVRVMQAQYPSLQSKKIIRMVPEKCTFQLKPGKERKQSAHQAQAMQFWFNICCKSSFPSKATVVINIEKIGLLSEQHKDEKLFVTASCLLI